MTESTDGAKAQLRVRELEAEIEQLRKQRSIAHHLIERNGRVMIETPVLVVNSVWTGIIGVVRALRDRP